MSQQEDDLRALAKIMDFLRATSILLAVINIYWFCYEAIADWDVNIGVVDKILMDFHRTAGLFGSSIYTIMLNLNKTWIQKQGDFFVESPIILLAAIIWYLKIYDNGRFCTFPHAIEFLNKRYEDIFPIFVIFSESFTDLADKNKMIRSN